MNETNRNETTAYLSELLEKKLNPHNDTRIYFSREVTFDFSGKEQAKRVDYMLFKPQNNTIGGIEKGDFFAYEVKSCVEDFRSKNGHNFVGDYNYYVMPKAVFALVEADIPWGIGVFCPGEAFGKPVLSCVKNARRMSRERATSEMLLMMFRSANRENIKNRKREKENNSDK